MSQPDNRKPSLTSPVTSQHSTASQNAKPGSLRALEKSVGGDPLPARMALMVGPEDLDLAKLATGEAACQGRPTGGRGNDVAVGRLACFDVLMSVSYGSFQGLRS